MLKSTFTECVLGPMSINSRCGLIKGVIHANPSCTGSDTVNAKINGKTLEMNVNDDKLSCAT